MKKLNRILSPVAGATFALLGLTATPAQAILNSNTLDFSKAKTASGAERTFEDDDAVDLDNGGIQIGGTTYSTNPGSGEVDASELFKGFGISISDNVGLFNSFCDTNLADGGTANDNSGVICTDDNNFINSDSRPRQSDPDLATGEQFSTSNQGYLLIVEENAGDGVPDDEGSGGILTFTFDDDIVAKIKEVTVVDDVDLAIKLFFDNDTTETINVTGSEDNEVVTADISSQITQDNKLDKVEFDFGSKSGGLSTVVFTEYRRVPFETETSFGVIIAAGYGLYRYYKHKKVASIHQQDKED